MKDLLKGLTCLEGPSSGDTKRNYGDRRKNGEGRAGEVLKPLDLVF